MDSEVRRPHKCTYHVWYSRKPLPQACQRFWLYMCKNTDLNGILKTSLTIEQGLLALTLVGNLSLEEKLFCDMVITQQFFPSSCQLFNSFQVCDIGAQMYSLMLGECLTFWKKWCVGKKYHLLHCLMGHWGYQQWNSNPLCSISLEPTVEFLNFRSFFVSSNEFNSFFNTFSVFVLIIGGSSGINGASISILTLVDSPWDKSKKKKLPGGLFKSAYHC